MVGSGTERGRKGREEGREGGREEEREGRKVKVRKVKSEKRTSQDLNLHLLKSVRCFYHAPSHWSSSTGTEDLL